MTRTSVTAPKRIAVIAHERKTFGGGRRELRRVLKEAGYSEPLWYEVPKSSKASKAIRRAMREGAELLYLWGGDGMVQRSIDAIVRHSLSVPIAILPAGTANLLANNLGVPLNVPDAVALGLRGARQAIDVGVVNGECFAVMAGTGADAITMRDVTKTAKKRVGALAYFRSGIHAIHQPPTSLAIRVNGKAWFEGDASCMLIGNVGAIQGGIELFPNASPVDGKLELAVVTAKTPMEWARVFARVGTGHASRSPFVRTTRATKITIAMAIEQPYELDGGDRDPIGKLKVRVVPAAVTICLPAKLKRPRRAL